MRTSFSAELEAWRVFRDDGTDVSFAVPRCILGCGAATEGEGARHAVSASAFGTHPRIPWDDGETTRFLRRYDPTWEVAGDMIRWPNTEERMGIQRLIVRDTYEIGADGIKTFRPGPAIRNSLP